MTTKRKYITIGIILVLFFVGGLLFYGLFLMTDEDRYGNLVYFGNKVEDGDIIFRNTKNGFNDFGIIEKGYFQKVYVWDSKNTMKQDLFAWAEKSDEEKVEVYRLFSKDSLNSNFPKLDSLRKSGKLKFIVKN